MLFVCPKCKTPFFRDMRLKASKAFITKKGYYKSWCRKSDCLVYCKPLNKLKK